jgi:hypothetical protein
MIRLQSGYHRDIAMTDYLADPCERPSLSTSTIDTLVRRTPMHAHAEHPRFGGAVDDPTKRGDMGSAVHSGIHGGAEVVFCGEVEMLGGKRKGEMVIPEDWATKGAQTFRDTARAEGKLPLLEFERHQYEGAVVAGKKALEAFRCESQETTMIWQLENGVWCRGRADFLGEHPQLGFVDIDTKTCDDADPYSWVRRCVQSNALDVQGGSRHIGHKTLGLERLMMWMLLELKFPWAVSFVAMSGELLASAKRKIGHASEKWAWCMKENRWPGYSDAPVWAGANTYTELELDERGVKP